MRLRVAILLALVVALVAAPSALAAKTTTKPSYLFAMTSTGGSLKHDASGWWVTLTGTSPMVTRFTDRPGREAATMTPTQLANRWRAYGFAKDAPNAALVLDGRSTDSDVYVVELRSPRVEGSTVLFRAKPLKTTSRALRHYVKRADRLQETTFGRASLFIDDGADTVFQPVEFTVMNMVPGQIVTIGLRANGTPVNFSSGPWGASTSGITFASNGAAAPPLEQLNMWGTGITIYTSPLGGGSTVTFTFSTFLAASEGIQSYFLTNTSDPGIQVMVTVGGIPRTISASPTPFAWQQ